MLEDSVVALTTMVRTECMGGNWNLSKIKYFGSHGLEDAVGRAVYYCVESRIKTVTVTTLDSHIQTK
jgi:hypothetical protein